MYNDYELISENEANRAKDILLNSSLKQDIKIESEKLDLKLFVNNSSEPNENQTFLSWNK